MLPRLAITHDSDVAGVLEQSSISLSLSLSCFLSSSTSSASVCPQNLSFNSFPDPEYKITIHQPSSTPFGTQAHHTLPHPYTQLKMLCDTCSNKKSPYLCTVCDEYVNLETLSDSCFMNLASDYHLAAHLPHVFHFLGLQSLVDDNLVVDSGMEDSRVCEYCQDNPPAGTKCMYCGIEK